MEIGIERRLRNFVVLGIPNNPRAKERNSGYIMVRKGQGIQVAFARRRRVSAKIRETQLAKVSQLSKHLAYSV